MKAHQLQYQLNKLFNIRRGEGFLVRTLFFHNFFQGTGIAFFFTAANALFLNEFDVSVLPWVYLLSGLMIIGSGRLFAYFEHRLEVKSLMIYVIGVLFFSPLLFYLGLTLWQSAGIIFLTMAFHRILYTLNSLEFWGLSALAFNVRQSKRLFPLIGAGDIPAKLLGYISVFFLVPYTGSEALLLFASGSFFLSFIFLNLILTTEKEAFDRRDPYPDFSIKSSVHSDVIFKSLFKSRYLFWISIFAIAGMFTLTLVDFAFLIEVKSEFKTKTELARFFGLLFSIGYGLTMLIKFFFSGRIIEALGVAYSAFILPIFLFLSAIGAILWGIFATDQTMMLWIFSSIYIGVDIIRYSIDDPNMMTLFQPLSKSLRLFGHTLIKSLMQPIGLLIAGMLLLIVLHIYGTVYLLYVCALLVAASGVLTILTDRVNYHYVVQLQEAVRTRYFEGSNIDLLGTPALRSLEERLQGGTSREAIHSLELLSRQPPKHWPELLKSALHHKSAVVRKFAIHLIKRDEIALLKERILELLDRDPDIEVRRAAVEALPSLAPDEIDRLYPCLESEDRSLRMGAYIALLGSGYLEAVVQAGRQLINHIESDDPEDRTFICQVLGEVGQHNDYKFLLHLLNDLDHEVRKHAITASAGVRHPSLLSVLFDLLKSKQHLPELIKSISSFGKKAVEEIERRLESNEISTDLKITFSRILEKIDEERADELLLAFLKDEVARVRSSALFGLKKKKFRVRSNDHSILEKFLEEELKRAFYLLHAELHCSADLMNNALFQERKRIEERILVALEFQYDPVRMRRARESFFDPSADLQAKALELFEYELPTSLYYQLEDLFGKKSIRDRLRKFARRRRISYPDDWREEILERECSTYSRWTVAVCIHTSGDATNSYENHLRKLQNHGVELIRQEVIRALSDQKAETMKKQHSSEQHLLQIEKVLLLKSTNMLQEIPEHILVDVADIAEVMELTEGETLFRTGDFGNRMFVIASGSIKIYDGDHVFSRLGEHDIFGELALLDPEPRSASAKAETDCVLLYIEQEPFLELLSAHTEVAKGILTILGRRLRLQNEQIVALQKERNREKES